MNHVNFISIDLDRDINIFTSGKYFFYYLTNIFWKESHNKSHRKISIIFPSKKFMEVTLCNLSAKNLELDN